MNFLNKINPLLQQIVSLLQSIETDTKTNGKIMSLISDASLKLQTDLNAISQALTALVANLQTYITASIDAAESADAATVSALQTQADALVTQAQGIAVPTIPVALSGMPTSVPNAPATKAAAK